MHYNTRSCSTAEEYLIESGGAISVEEVTGTEAEGAVYHRRREECLHDWEQNSGVLTGGRPRGGLISCHEHLRKVFPRPTSAVENVL